MVSCEPEWDYGPNIEFDPACNVCGAEAEYAHHMAEKTLQLCGLCIGRWVDPTVWVAIPADSVKRVVT